MSGLCPDPALGCHLTPVPLGVAPRLKIENRGNVSRFKPTDVTLLDEKGLKIEARERDQNSMELALLSRGARFSPACCPETRQAQGLLTPPGPPALFLRLKVAMGMASLFTAGPLSGWAQSLPANAPLALKHPKCSEPLFPSPCDQRVTCPCVPPPCSFPCGLGAQRWAKI